MSGLRARLRHAHDAFSLDADIAAPSRGITALFGASGAGKTTILRCIAGLTRARDAQVTMDGECWQDEAHGVFVPPHERACGYVFQEASLFPHLSVRGNLEYGHKRAPRAQRAVAFERAVEMLGLAPLLERACQGLSGGERQRVAIGRALLAGPRVLLMDEPLASLDASRKGEILYHVERLRDELGIPIVYVSHAIDEVVRLADAMIVISEGKSVAAGTVAALSTRLDLRPYLGRFEAGAVLEVSVAEQDLHFGLTRLRFDGGDLYAADVDALVGERLRVRIRARDVSLALTAPRDASFLNVLSGFVAQIGEAKGAGVDVAVRVGAATIVARITRKSVDALALAPGKPVVALVKSVALDRHSVGYS
jgi:molybdate transport system ATP-binding protein